MPHSHMVMSSYEGSNPSNPSDDLGDEPARLTSAFVHGLRPKNTKLVTDTIGERLRIRIQDNSELTLWFENEEARKAIGKLLSGDISIEDAPIKQLLHELIVRLAFWNSCAVGETFSLKKTFGNTRTKTDSEGYITGNSPENAITEDRARNYLINRGYGAKTSNRILELGIEIVSQVQLANSTFNEIQELHANPKSLDEPESERDDSEDSLDDYEEEL